MDFKGLSLSSLFVFIIIFRNLAEVDKMSLIQLPQREIDKKRLVISTSSRYKPNLSLRLRPAPFKQRNSEILQMLLAKTKMITLHLSTACLLGRGFALSTWFRAKRKNMKILARKRTPSGREKGVRTWVWPLTRM